MSNQPDRRGRMAAVAIALVSVLIGGGVAFAAISAVVTSSAPNDKIAVNDGNRSILPASDVINYGG